MTRTQIATADFSCGGMQKGTNGDESDERLRTENSYIDNRHKHTIIATLSVKKGSKFTDPDAQFPRGGALACARGSYTPTSEKIHFDIPYSLSPRLENKVYVSVFRLVSGSTGRQD